MTDATNASVPFPKSRASVLLDLVRGLAACLVILEHWRNLFFVDYGNVPAHRGLYLVPYLVASAGHQAVMIFFVLSGFLISGSVFRMLERGSWNWRSYLTHRLVRLWVVLVPGLLLCLLFDTLGLHSGRAPELYTIQAQNHMGIDVAADLGLKTFFGNVFFLQGILTDRYGSDTPLWSLSYEFWYYVLFPLGLLTIHRRSKMLQRVISGVLFVVVAKFVGLEILESFPIWLAGTALYLAPPLRAGRGTRVAASVGYVLLFFFCARPRGIQLSDLSRDTLLTLGTFGFFWVLLSAREAAMDTAGTKISRGLASFSYSMYMYHLPPLLLVTAFLLGDSRWAPSAGHDVVALGILIGTFAYSYGVAALTEFHTDTWRGWVETRMQVPWRERTTA